MESPLAHRFEDGDIDHPDVLGLARRTRVPNEFVFDSGAGESVGPRRLFAFDASSSAEFNPMSKARLNPVLRTPTIPSSSRNFGVSTGRDIGKIARFVEVAPGGVTWERSRTLASTWQDL
jgi:hypothetical protein